MKKMNKFAAISIASLMAVSVMAPIAAFAEGETTSYSITVNNTAKGHTYEAYQIFAGTLDDDKLTVTGWGTGVKGDDLMTALKATTGFESLTDEATAATVAGILEGKEADSAELQNFAKVVGANLTTTKVSSTDDTYKMDLTAAGYYLVKDQDGSLDGSNDAATRYIVQVLGTATVDPKTGLPSVMKKVYEDDKTATTMAKIGSLEETEGNWNDVADYCIGDAVPFKLYGTMPQNLADYAGYKYVFHDTLASNFTAPANTDITVKVDGTATDKATVVIDGGEITVTFDDIKQVEGITANSIVTVEYTAVLNNTANIGLPGQENKVYLTYSNNPNWVPVSETDKPEDNGQTPEDEVVVFTYAVEIDKTFVNAAGDDLTAEEIENRTYEGVTFTLQDEDGNTLTFSTKEVTDGEGNTTTVYYVDEAGSEDIKIDELCHARIEGLDDGTYTLVEKEAPTGYNKAPDAEVVITAGTKNDQNYNGDETTALTSFEWKVTGEEDAVTGTATDATVSLEILNKKGTTLPSTGGLGTTLFYLIGGALVASSGVLLITKKRTEDAQ